MGTATAEALHLQHLLAEAQLTSREPTLILHTDSTSAKSLASRVGLGRKSKHIQLRYLYLQELVTNKLLTLVKKLQHLKRLATVSLVPLAFWLCQEHFGLSKILV